MPRSIIILVAVVVVIIGALFVVASFDSAVPITRVEQPVTNATAR